MEVTRKNFQESLSSIASAIDEASFLAIDGEFTGLNHSGLAPTAVFDSPEERYQKLLQGSTDFLIIQFGLCAFSYNGKTKQYTAKPFNFYIFPKPFSRSAPDLRFSCQSSSIDFLLSNGFDFNKVFKEGIPFLRPADDAILRESVQKRHEVFKSPSFFSPAGSDAGVVKGPVDVPPEHKEFIDNICKLVEKFIESGEADHMSLAPCTPYQRKLTYQTLKSKFGSDVHLQTKTGEKKDRYIVITRIKGEADMKKIEDDKQGQDLAEIDAALGFTHVIKMISQSGKLVVGHNILLDIIHTIHQFMYPLPPDYQDFKTMCRCVFPKLIDTKLMASTQPFKERIDNSGLNNLLTISEFPPFSKPEVVIGEGFDNRYKENEALHEAGYDAYITGRCFISLSNFLGQCQNPPAERVPPASPLLEPFLNKIFMMRSLDIPYMDLSAPDLNPTRDHVFHLKFPAEWRASDINMLFAQFGSIHIGWLDESSAFVALHSRSAATTVLKTLCKKSSVYRLMAYKDYKQQYHWQAPARPSGQVTSATPDPNHHGYAPRVPSSQPSDNTQQKTGTKRSHSSDDENQENKKRKSLNVDAPVFESRITPTTTPEKEGDGKWPHNINSGGKKIVILKRPSPAIERKQEFAMDDDDFPPLCKV